MDKEKSVNIEFQNIIDVIASLGENEREDYPYVALGSMLLKMDGDEFQYLQKPQAELSLKKANIVAASVEDGADLKGVRPPKWVKDIPPCDKPVFPMDTQHAELRVWLMAYADPIYKRRNLFFDTTIKDQV